MWKTLWMIAVAASVAGDADAQTPTAVVTPTVAPPPLVANPPPIVTAPPPQAFGPPPLPPWFLSIEGYPPAPWWLLPEELSVSNRPNTPQGYHRVTTSDRPMVVTGGVLFASGWGLSIIALAAFSLSGSGSSSDSSGYLPLAIPIAGPFIALGTGKELRFSNNTGYGALMILDGVGQSVGLALFIAGLAHKRDVYVRDWATPPWMKDVDARIGPRSFSLTASF